MLGKALSVLRGEVAVGGEIQHEVLIYSRLFGNWSPLPEIVDHWGG